MAWGENRRVKYNTPQLDMNNCYIVTLNDKENMHPVRTAEFSQCKYINKETLM